MIARIMFYITDYGVPTGGVYPFVFPTVPPSQREPTVARLALIRTSVGGHYNAHLIEC